MKKLAKKLYKLQLKGELNGSLISHAHRSSRRQITMFGLSAKRWLRRRGFIMNDAAPQPPAPEQPQAEHDPVGEAGPMPGADGFTMACFRASDVPVGAKLYTHPQPKREPLCEDEGCPHHGKTHVCIN